MDNPSNYFVHPQALCESKQIGAGTRVWAFTHILENARVGKDCNICDHTFIEGDVVIGDRVTIKCGVQLWNGLRVEDDVFIGPNVAFTNDAFPRSKKYPAKFLETRICKGASISANATILPGLTIHQNAMVGAGAVVTRSVPPNAIVTGNPARITGYVGATNTSTLKENTSLPLPVEGTVASSVRDVKLTRLPIIEDLRGDLSVGNFAKEVPFNPMRYFLVFNVPSKEVRGEHAHHKCEQFLVCLKGSCSVVVDDGKNREEVSLNTPGLGLYLPPMVWGIQYKYSADAVLLVFASLPYDPKDYIRNYEDFLRLQKESQ